MDYFQQKMFKDLVFNIAATFSIYWNNTQHITRVLCYDICLDPRHWVSYLQSILLWIVKTMINRTYIQERNFKQIEYYRIYIFMLTDLIIYFMLQFHYIIRTTFYYAVENNKYINVWTFLPNVIWSQDIPIYKIDKMLTKLIINILIIHC